MSDVRSMRSITNDMLPVQSFSELSKSTFINDGIKAWNLAPKNIKDCTTYATAKNEIKKFVKTIPIWFKSPKFFSMIKACLREINIYLLTYLLTGIAKYYFVL